MTNLHAIVYVSSAVWFLTEEELVALLNDAREDNRKHQITGVLLYCDGMFFQYIEGPAEHLDKIYAKIKKSSQHHGIIECHSGSVETRQFSEWYMGFFQPTKNEFLQISNRECWCATAALALNCEHTSEGIQALKVFCENNSSIPQLGMVNGRFA